MRNSKARMRLRRDRRDPFCEQRGWRRELSFAGEHVADPELDLVMVNRR
jgi:hypothetical protein